MKPFLFSHCGSQTLQLFNSSTFQLFIVNLTQLRQSRQLLFEGISGSRAYGLDLPGSDTDYRGVFILSKKQFYGLNYTEQISSPTNDEVFYELRRFGDLLAKNNPNILEMLNIPADCIVYRHPLFERFQARDFLSKLCRDTFAGYAVTQIKKARGLNKKIHNPQEPERKTPLHFCYVVKNQGSTPLLHWLEEQNLQQERCGLVNIPNMRDMYALFYDHTGDLHFSGIIQKESANEVALSSVPKGSSPLAILSFNKDGYSAYCRSYREYWEWVSLRNEERYQNTLQHGKNYDAKNMMHTFRLLDMAAEILSEGQVVVRRPNREELLAIRRGDFLYEDLIEKAEEKIAQINELYETCSLPETPNLEKIEDLLYEVRETLYQLG